MKVPLAVRAIPGYTFRAWFTPPPYGSGARRRDAGAITDATRVEIAGHSGFAVGSGPLVLAVHGWGGRSAQMVPLAHHLAQAGYRVVAVDLPGHAGGPPTDVKEAAAALRSVAAETGAPAVVIGHSFASMVVRLAFADDPPPVVVLLAPLVRVRDGLEVFADRLRLFPWAQRGLAARLEAWDPEVWPMVFEIRPEQLPGADVLILHDPGDGETPFASAAELAARRPGTEIVAVDGAGHSGILADPVALDVMAAYLAERTSVRAERVEA